MTRLSSSKREELYDAEARSAFVAGRGYFPICNICDGPIDGRRERWHESHNPLLPRALGGEVTGIAHERCNLDHARKIDVPLIAKSNRVRQKYIGAKVRKGRPMVGTRDSNIKLRIGGGRPIDRRTGREL